MPARPLRRLRLRRSTRTRARARACRCRPQPHRRAARARAARRGHPAPLPRRLASTARRSRDDARAAGATSRGATSRALDEHLDAGPRAVVLRRRRHRQDDARDARLRAALEAGRTRRDLLAAAPAGRDPRDVRERRARAPTSTLLDRLTAVDLLHVDDVGAEKTSPWVLEQLYAIVNARYEDERAIVITTNLERDALRRADRRAHGLAPRGDVRRLPLLGRDQRARCADAARRRARVACGRPRLRRLAPRLTHGMPGIVIVGAQWGDEGKGKVVDLLAEHADVVVALPGRQQRRPHDRARRARSVQVPPDPVRDPLPRQAVRDRQRRGDRPAGADRRDRRAARRAASTSRACASAPTRT